MPELLFNLYMADGQDKAMLFLSSVPSFDRRFLQNEGYDSFVLITPPLPLGTAAKVYCELQKRLITGQGHQSRCLWKTPGISAAGSCAE